MAAGHNPAFGLSLIQSMGLDSVLWPAASPYIAEDSLGATVALSRVKAMQMALEAVGASLESRIIGILAAYFSVVPDPKIVERSMAIGLKQPKKRSKTVAALSAAGTSWPEEAFGDAVGPQRSRVSGWCGVEPEEVLRLSCSLVETPWRR